MKIEKLNHWLMLAANVGVLIGIIVVVVELRQTQTAMSAEASSTRAQMALEIGGRRLSYQWHLIPPKLANGETLSVDEEFVLERVELDMLRYFEDLHYQNSIGVLDEEIWEANLSNIISKCKQREFQHVLPNWPNEPEASRFRASFVALVAEGCE